MRLIDADELKKLFPDEGEGSWTYNITAKSYIDSAPTVDNRKTNEETRTTILSKIDYILGGINCSSFRSDDLTIAQTVQALAAAYKDIKTAEPEK